MRAFVSSGLSPNRRSALPFRRKDVWRPMETLESRLLLAVTHSLDGLRATFTGDADNNTLFVRVSVAYDNLEFSTDGVNYSEDLDDTVPGVQSLPAGALALLAVNMGTGNDALVVDASLNAAMSATGGTLAFTGGGGIDGLVGPAVGSTWRLTGADTGTLNGWIEFTGIANLTGSATGNDLYVLEPAGSSSGTLNGGAGGADEILPSTNSTDIIGYTPGGTLGAGTVQRNGVTIGAYSDIELTDDITGNAATRRFEGTMYPDRVRVYRPEAGKIAIESTSDDPVVGSQTIIFDDPTSALVINLGRNLILTDEHVYIESLGDFNADIIINTQAPVADGPDAVEIRGNLNLLGHKLEVQTDDFTVKSGVQVVTSVSGGIAGDIHVLAHHIVVENWAGLLAEGATSGSILLQAENPNTYFTPLVNIDITDTDVAIGDATIRGGSVSITALSNTQHILDLNDTQSGQFNNGFPNGTTFGSIFGTILDGVLGALELGVFAGVAVGKSTATIDVSHGATISAASDLVIHASGLARAATAPVLQKGGGIAVGVAITDAEVNLDGTISSGGDMTIRATADHMVDVLTDTSGAAKFAGAVAVSVISSKAIAHVKEGASLTVGGDLCVQADTIDRNRTLARSTSGTDGDVAISAAVSVEHGETQSLLDGNAKVAGIVSVNAQQSKQPNTANKIFVIPGWATGVAAVAGAGVNTTGDFLDDTKSAAIGTAITFLKGLFTSEENKWVNGTIAKDNVSTLDLSGAFAVVVDTNNVTARIGDGGGSRADVEADGSVEVTATVENRPDITASSSAIAADPDAPPAPSGGTQSTKFGGSAAISVGTYHNNANVYIAEDADVDAKLGVTVAAHTLNRIDPASLWGANLIAPFFASADFTSDQGVQTVHNGDIVEVAAGHTGGGDEGSWYKYVGGGSNSIDLGTADYKDANVWLELGSPVANTGLNLVRTWTTYLNDNLGLDNNLVDNWSQAVAQNQEISIAGAISILNLDHTATAGIRGGANINQRANGASGTDNFRTGNQDVVVTAESVNMLVSLGGNFLTPGLTGDTNKFTINPQMPGAGSKNDPDGKGAVGATVLLFDEDNTVTARIDDGAKVYADSLEVSADTFVVNATLAASGGDAGNFGFNGAFVITMLDNKTLAQIQNGAAVVVGNGTVKSLASADFSSDQGFENVSTGNIVEVRTRDANGLITQRHWYKYLGSADRMDLSSQDYSSTALWQDLGTNGAALGTTDRGASVLVEATDRSYVVTVTGGVCVSDHIGVGASAGVNVVNRDTLAVVGNLSDDVSGDASQAFASGGNVQVHSRNGGFIGVFSVAGSVSSQNSDSSPQGQSGMTTSGGSSTSNPMDLAAGPIIGQHRGLAGDTSSNPADGGAGTNTGKAGISISGAVGVNIVDDNARAYIRNTGAVTVTGGGELQLLSENTTSVGSLAGAVALSLGGGTNSTTQVAIAGAVGLNFMDGDTEAYLDGATSLSSAGFDAEARRSGYIVSLTAGVAGAVGRSGYAVAGSVGVTRTTFTTETALRNTTGTVSGPIALRADDDTNIVLVNGAGGFGGKVGVGAAVSFTEIENTTRALVEHVKGDLSSGKPNLKYTGGMRVEARSDGDIIAVTASAGVGTGQGGVGIGASGTVSVNIIDNTVEAKIVDTESTADSAGPVKVHAQDNSFIFSFAGAFGAGKTAGFGAALASNFLTNTVAAVIDDSKLRSTGTLDVLAEETGGLVAVGAGGAGGKVAVAGGIAVNQTANKINARISGGSDVTASGAITVQAYDRTTVVGIAGGGAGGSQVAIGASVSVNLLDNDITANLDDSRVESTGSTLDVLASADTVLVDVGVAGAGAGTFAGGASVAVNQLGNALTAAITDSNGDSAGLATEVRTSGSLTVRASDNSTIVVVAGSGAGAGTAAVGAAAATVQAENTINAYVEGAVLKSTNGNVEITAGFAPPSTDANLQAVAVGTNDVLLPTTSGSQIVNITVGAAGAGTVAGGAAISLTWLRNDVRAYIAGGSDVDAYGDVTIAAADSPEIDSAATAGAGSGTVAAAFAISYNYIGGDPGDPARNIPADPASTNVGQARAYIDASQVDASAGLYVLADTQPRIINATVAGAGSGTVGGGGAVSINFIRSVVDASITNSSGTGTAGLALHANANDSVSLQATTTPLMVVIAGNGSGGGAAGIGAASATNDSQSQISARIEGSSVTATTGNVLVNAEVKAPSSLPDIMPVSEPFDAQIWSFAVSGAGAGGASVAGSLSLNWIRNTVDAHISSGATVHADSATGGVTVSAADHSTINAIAGTGSGSGGFAIGASVAYNYIGGDPDDPASTDRNAIKAYIDGSTVTAHTVKVDASSDSNINNLCFAGSGAGTFALGGSVSLNFIRKTVDAHIAGASASVTASGSGSEVNVSAYDSSTINVLSVQGAGAGFVAGGAALAYNDISNTIKAYADHGAITANLGSVNLSAASDSDITSVAAGIGAAGAAAVAGSAAANLLAIETLAYISAASVTADNNVTLIADADNRITTVGGTLAIGGVVGIGGSVVFSKAANTTKAYIDSDATVLAKGLGDGAAIPVWASDNAGTESIQAVRGLSVIASTNEAIMPTATTAGIALPSGGGNVGIGANIITTLVGDTTEAYVDDSNINSLTDQGQSIVIRAHQDSDITSSGGSLGVGDVGLGADVHVNVISNSTKAYITDTDPGTTAATRTAVFGSTGVEINALAREHVQEVAVGAGIGTWVGAAGAAAAIKTTSTTEAYVKESALTASAGNIDILANSRTGLELYTGALGASLAVGAGLSVAVGLIANTTTAHVDGAITNSSGTTTVKATSGEDVASAVATAGVGSYGISGSVAVISTESTTSAAVGQGTATRNSSLTSTADSIVVAADNTTSVDDGLGAAALGLNGSLGAGVDVIRIRNNVTATVDSGATLTAAGNVSVAATSNRNVDSVAVAFGISAGIGVAGAVSVISIDTGLTSDAAGQVSGMVDDVNGVLAPADGFGGLHNDPNDSDSTSDVIAAAIQGNTFTITADSDSTLTGTDARVTAGASVTATSGDVTVAAHENVNITDANGGAGQLVGAGAVGVFGVSVGGSVAITTVSGSATACIEKTALISAGSLVGVDSAYDTDLSGRAYGGSAGLVGLGAQVAIVDDHSNATAQLEDGTSAADAAGIMKASSLSITAGGSHTVSAEAKGASGGGLAAGVAVAKAHIDGSTTARVGNYAQIGQDANPANVVGDMLISASASNTASADEKAVSVGVLADGNGNISEATVTPTIQAVIGTNAAVTTGGDVTLEAASLGDGVSAVSKGVGGSLVAHVGVSYATASFSPILAGEIGSYSSIVANDRAVTVRAIHNQAGETAYAEAGASGGGALAGNGAVGTATASAQTNSLIGTYAAVNAGQGVLVAAASSNSAHAKGGQLSVGLVAVGAAKADAYVQGSTLAQVDSHATIGSATNPAGALTISAAGADFGFAETSATSGGVVDVDADMGAVSTSTVSPTVAASLGESSAVTVNGDVSVTASDTTDSDASANGTNPISGVKVGGSKSTTDLTPNVTAAVDSFAAISAGGAVTISATHGASTSVANGTFDPATDVNSATDCITFSSPHGLVSGDTVTYVTLGAAQVVGGLVNGRSYNVLDTPTGSSVTLGNTFDAADVSIVNDTITFSGPHGLQDNDSVFYDVRTGTAVDGLAAGSSYYVRVIDDLTIKLSTAPVSPVSEFAAAEVDLANDRINLAGFTDGDPVTYRAAPPFICATSDVHDTDNTIDWAAHGLVTGTEIIYGALGNPIGSLQDDGHYFVVVVDGDHIQLAATYADATAVDGDGNPAPITIDLDPGASDNDSHHAFTVPIAGLHSGQTYYVVNSDGSSFQLAATAGGSALDIDAANIPGTQTIGAEGLDFTAAGSGTQALRIDITAAATAGAENQLSGAGGGLILGAQAGSDGIANAYAHGSSGSVLGNGVHQETSATASVTVSATVGDGAWITSGTDSAATNKDIAITALGAANSSARSTNSASAGFGSNGSATSSAAQTAINSATIGASATIASGGNFTLTASTSTWGDSNADSSGGSTIKFASATADTEATYANKAMVGDSSAIAAQGDLTINAVVSNVYAHSFGYGDARGLGGDATGNNTVSLGAEGSYALSQVAIGQGVVIDAANVDLLATLAKARLDGYAKSYAAALGADSDAKSHANLYETTDVTVATSAVIRGDGHINLKSTQNNVGTQAHSNAICHAAGGDTDSNAYNETHPTASIVAAPAASLYTPNLYVQSYVNVTDDARIHERTKAFIDVGGSHAHGTTTQARLIDFDSDVFFLGGPSPKLVVDAIGNVVTADGVTIDDTDDTNGIGPVSTPQIVVDDIASVTSGTAYFEALGSNSNGNVARISGTQSTFTFQDGLGRVDLINASSKDLVVNNISVINATVQPTVQINVSRVDQTGALTFLFDIVRDVADTVVHIENTLAATAGAPDIIFQGLVDNPIGTTEVYNAGGDIRSSDSAGMIRTNTADLRADQGDIGDPANTASRLNLQLVQSADRPTSLQVLATSGDVYLDLAGILRDPTPPAFAGNVVTIQAGHDVDLLLEDSVLQSTLDTAHGAVNVTVPPEKYDQNLNFHFRPDTAGTPDLNLGAFADTSDTNTSNVNGLWSFGSTSLAGLIAGHNISVQQALAPVTTLSVTGYTDTTGSPASGFIDVAVNGPVSLCETSGDMRVGNIVSTGDDVTLTATGSIVDAADDAVADVTGRNVTLNAGIANTSGTGGIGSASNVLEINSSNSASGLVTASAPDSIYLYQVDGDMNLGLIKSDLADAWLLAEDSILDGADDAAADVVASNINLEAGIRGSDGADGLGSIGAVANDLEIDSSFANTADNSLLTASAKQHIYLTESDHTLNVFLVNANAGDIRLTMPDTAAALNDQDLNVVTGGIIEAAQSILLRIGDDLLTTDTSRITAGTSLAIYGDWLNADPGAGTAITVRGTIEGHPSQIFGNTDGDVITFVDTLVNGPARVYGSNSADILDNGGNDGQEQFIVTRLQSMTTYTGTSRDTLDLDGQGKADTYTIDTSADLRDYMVNILDGGDGADGLDTLTINGTAGPDVFDVSSLSVARVLQVAAYLGIEQLQVLCLDGNDICNATPSATTQYFLDGGPHPTGDTLNFDAQGAIVNNDGVTITGATFMPVGYTRFELLHYDNAIAAAPTNVDLAAASDTGRYDRDDLTKLDNGGADRVLSFLVTGTIPGTTVTLYADGVAIGIANATSTATWVQTNATYDLIDGQHTMTARQEGSGLSVSGTSPALPVTVDTVAPSILSWASAANYGWGVGEVGLVIVDNGKFTEPRATGIRLLLLTPSEAIDPGSWLPASVGLWGNGLSGALDLSSIAITTSIRSGGVLALAFSSQLPDVAKYLVRVGGLADLAGNALNGRSGDNDRVMTALLGDVTGDGRVNNTDVGAVQSLLGTVPISAASENQLRSDVTLDGRINNTDIGAVISKRGNDARFIATPVAPPGLTVGAGSPSERQSARVAIRTADTLLAISSESNFTNDLSIEDRFKT